MAKYTFYCSTGFVGSLTEEVIEIPDEELEGLSDKEKEKLLLDYWWDFMANNCDFGWYETDEDEE
jgi:hypothetical protein